MAASTSGVVGIVFGAPMHGQHRPRRPRLSRRRRAARRPARGSQPRSTAAGTEPMPGHLRTTASRPAESAATSRFTRRKARPRDLAERRAADDVAGRTEVRMVEQIEHVRRGTAGRSCPAGLHVLDERQIRVVEGRSDDDVSAQIAEAIDGHEHRRIEPLVHRTDDADGPGDVGTDACSARRSACCCS